MSGPQLSIDLGRIERNARAVTALCGAHGISVFGVTKGACGMPQVARAMLRGGVAGIAESRFENIRRLRAAGITAPVMLLRSPPVSRAEEVVRTVDVSLQSELSIIREISRIAERMGRVHDIMLMLDLGDLREGIWPTHLTPTVEEVLTLKGVRIAGIGTNLGCFGAIVPTEDNLGQLVAHAYKVESLSGRRLDYVSGGASSSLPLLLAGRLPAGISNLRVGEAILQGGLETFRDEPWDALALDACRLSAELIEVKLKPSRPIGRSGYDAFGNQPVFADEGDRLRAIANIGREDVVVEGLTPTHKGVRILGGSSDHLLMDVGDADPPIAVGDRLSFRMGYGAMLLAMTSEYVEKVPVHDVEADPRRRMARIVADAQAATVLARLGTGARLEAMAYDVVEPGDDARLPSGLVGLSAGADRSCALPALRSAVASTHSLGLIWIDARAALEPGAAPDGGVLAEILGLVEGAASLQPQLSPENVVLVGLRGATQAETAVLARAGVTVVTAADVGTAGIGAAMAEALRVAGSGTRGYHVCYATEATAFAGWPHGAGGLSPHATRDAMAAIARDGRMLSISAAGLTAALDPQIAEATVDLLMEAFGPRAS